MCKLRKPAFPFANVRTSYESHNPLPHGGKEVEVFQAIHSSGRGCYTELQVLRLNRKGELVASECYS